MQKSTVIDDVIKPNGIHLCLSLKFGLTIQRIDYGHSGWQHEVVVAQDNSQVKHQHDIEEVLQPTRYDLAQLQDARAFFHLRLVHQDMNGGLTESESIVVAVE